MKYVLRDNNIINIMVLYQPLTNTKANIRYIMEAN